jgi:hypothetical protein
MLNQLGPFEICCDAPPYLIVKACSRIGFHAPEDVRWCRIGHHAGTADSWRQLIPFTPWNVFLKIGQRTEKACSCGRRLPQLEGYTFTLSTGKELSYGLGQCGRCRTIFWEEASSPPSDIR